MRSRVLAVGAVAALTAALTGGPVHAAPPSLTANQAFDTLAAERGLAGFAGVTNDGSHLTLWWKGAPPAAVTNRLTAAHSSLPIVVRRAAYSMAEIRRAAEPIKALLAHPQPHLRGVMIPPDGHGLEVVTDGSPDALKGLPAVGVPVSVRAWTNFSFLDSRLDDSSPWSGGGRLKIYNGSNYLGYCTTGWGVHSASGTRYLLTAAHCGKTGTRFTDGAGELIGYGNQDRNDLDIMLIPTYSANNMWDGPVASGNFLKWVAGSDDARPNDQLCTSGSTSGAVC
ncbi:MAG: hypothetical protein HOV66_23075, partial [Streptomycetaceae bacterium]|nr:hypothetical protein [Streptomycetaceae bacterium]